MLTGARVVVAVLDGGEPCLWPTAACLGHRVEVGLWERGGSGGGGEGRGRRGGGRGGRDEGSGGRGKGKRGGGGGEGRGEGRGGGKRGRGEEGEERGEEEEGNRGEGVVGGDVGKVKEAIACVEAERVLCGVFPVEVVRGEGGRGGRRSSLSSVSSASSTSWAVRDGVPERAVTQRLVVGTPLRYYTPHEVPELSELGHTRLRVLIEDLTEGGVGSEGKREQNGEKEVRGAEETGNGRDAVVTMLRKLEKEKVESGGENGHWWTSLRDAGWCVTAGAFEATLRGHTRLERRRVLQHLCTVAHRSTKPGTELGVFRSSKISLSAGVYLSFLAVPGGYFPEFSHRRAVTSPQFVIRALLFGPSVVLDTLEVEYRDENLLRATSLREHETGSGDAGTYSADCESGIVAYYRELLSPTSADQPRIDLHTSVALSQPSLDEDDFVDLTGKPEIATAKRARTQKASMDEAQLSEALIEKLQASHAVRESELFEVFGRSHRVRAALSRVGLLTQQAEVRIWKIRPEYAQLDV